MELPKITELFSQAREMQSKMAEMQQALAARRIEGQAGGGMVTATVSGTLRVLDIKIEATLLASDDPAMLQDLTAAAVNAALENAQRVVQEEMQKVTGGLSLPNIPGLGGLGGS